MVAQGEGGVYAELIPNRDFETLGRGRIPTAARDTAMHDAAARDTTMHDAAAVGTVDDDDAASPPLDPKEHTASSLRQRRAAPSKPPHAAA